MRCMGHVLARGRRQRGTSLCRAPGSLRGRRRRDLGDREMAALRADRARDRDPRRLAAQQRLDRSSYDAAGRRTRRLSHPMPSVRPAIRALDDRRRSPAPAPPRDSVPRSRATRGGARLAPVQRGDHASPVQGRRTDDVAVRLPGLVRESGVDARPGMHRPCAPRRERRAPCPQAWPRLQRRHSAAGSHGRPVARPGRPPPSPGASSATRSAVGVARSRHRETPPCGNACRRHCRPQPPTTPCRTRTIARGNAAAAAELSLHDQPAASTCRHGDRAPRAERAATRREP